MLPALLLQPSFYASITWWIWFAVYLVNPVGWQTPGVNSLILYFEAGIAWTAATVFFLPFFRETSKTKIHFEGSTRLAIVLCALGALGIFIHAWILSERFYGIYNLISSLISSSYEIRWENAEMTTIGVQLSYLGWIGCGMLAFLISSRKQSAFYVVIIGMILLLNVAMVDRTRPFWIIFTSGFMYVAGRHVIHRTRNIIRITLQITAGIVFLISVFATVAFWTGKVGEDLPGASYAASLKDNFIIYGTGGFAYSDRILKYHQITTGIPERTLYPLFRMLATMDIVEQPPSQVLEFEQLPFDVNVGTFLEPLISDGGFLFAFFAAPILIFFTNLIALYFLRSGRLISLYAVSSLSFSAFFSHFTSHFSSTPLWLFCILGILDCLVISQRNKT